jgi:hypothetical protein
MEQRSSASRPIDAARATGYSRYADPAVFPRFGGDEFDPPAYSTDRRSTVDAATAIKPRSAKPHGGVIALARAMLSRAMFLHRKFNASAPTFTLFR